MQYAWIALDFRWLKDVKRSVMVKAGGPCGKALPQVSPVRFDCNTFQFAL